MDESVRKDTFKIKTTHGIPSIPDFTLESCSVSKPSTPLTHVERQPMIKELDFFAILPQTLSWPR